MYVIVVVDETKRCVVVGLIDNGVTNDANNAVMTQSVPKIA